MPWQHTTLCFVLALQMPVAVGPYGQTQPSCFDRVKMGFMMGFAVGMAAGAMFGTFSCLRYHPGYGSADLVVYHTDYCQTQTFKCNHDVR